MPRGLAKRWHSILQNSGKIPKMLSGILVHSWRAIDQLPRESPSLPRYGISVKSRIATYVSGCGEDSDDDARTVSDRIINRYASWRRHSSPPFGVARVCRGESSRPGIYSLTKPRFRNALARLSPTCVAYLSPFSLKRATDVRDVDQRLAYISWVNLGKPVFNSSFLCLRSS